MSSTLTQDERRTLSELLDHGMGLSTENIARFSNTEWDIVSASVAEMARAAALSQYRGDQGAHFGAKLRSRSVLPLDILVIYPEDSARAIAAAVARTAGPQVNSLPDRDKAILAELSNILGQGLIAAMVDWFNVSVVLTVPQMLEGSKTAIVEGALSDFKDQANTLLISHIQMISKDISAECVLMLILDTAVVRRVLKLAGTH